MDSKPARWLNSQTRKIAMNNSTSIEGLPLCGRRTADRTVELELKSDCVKVSKRSNGELHVDTREANSQHGQSEREILAKVFANIERQCWIGETLIKAILAAADHDLVGPDGFCREWNHADVTNLVGQLGEVIFEATKDAMTYGELMKGDPIESLLPKPTPPPPKMSSDKMRKAEALLDESTTLHSLAFDEIHEIKVKIQGVKDPEQRKAMKQAEFERIGYREDMAGKPSEIYATEANR